MDSKDLIVTHVMKNIRDRDNYVSNIMGLGQTLLGCRKLITGGSNIVVDVHLKATLLNITNILMAH